MVGCQLKVSDHFTLKAQKVVQGWWHPALCTFLTGLLDAPIKQAEPKQLLTSWLGPWSQLLSLGMMIWPSCISPKLDRPAAGHSQL